MIANFAATEAKAVLRTHCSTIYALVDRPEVQAVTPAVKEAMLECLARMYEVIEKFPVIDPTPPQTNCEGDVLNG